MPQTANKQLNAVTNFSFGNPITQPAYNQGHNPSIRTPPSDHKLTVRVPSSKFLFRQLDSDKTNIVHACVYMFTYIVYTIVYMEVEVYEHLSCKGLREAGKHTKRAVTAVQRPVKAKRK